MIAAGAWATPLLARIGIELETTVSRETVSYFPLPGVGALPSVIDWNEHTGRHAYSLATEEELLKVGLHHSGTPAEPDAPGEPDPEVVAAASEWVARRYPMADPNAERCGGVPVHEHRRRRLWSRAARPGRRLLRLLGARIQVRSGGRRARGAAVLGSRGVIEPLRLGIVGCGWVTLERHLPSLRHVDEVEVVALADTDPRALGRAAAFAPSARHHDSTASLAADPVVEAVAVCVPPAEHVDVALAAISHGKHVLVEKPLAASLGDADRLTAEAEGSPVKVVVGFNFRRHRFVTRTRELIAAGELGAVTCIRSAFTNDVPFDAAARWRGSRSLGGGGILDRAVHEIDLWRFLLDDEVARVSACAVPGRTEDDVAVVTAQMRGGALATIVVLDSAVVSHELTVYGSRAAARLATSAASTASRSRRAHTCPGPPRARLNRARTTLSDPKGGMRAIRRGGDHLLTYEDEWRSFAEIVRRDLPAQPSIADGRAALEVALAAIESADTGAPVELHGTLLPT